MTAWPIDNDGEPIEAPDAVTVEQIAAKVLTGRRSPEASAATRAEILAAWVWSKLHPNGEPVAAVVDADGVLTCSRCGGRQFGYLEGCADYRTPGDQGDGLVSVTWHADGTSESGDDNPGLFCDNFRGDGCGRPIELPDGWEIDFD